MPKNEVTETKLTAGDRKELAKHETTIRDGLTSFIEVGHALAAIRDSVLYREEYGTFEAYVEDKWDLARRTAYQKIQAAEVVAEIQSVRSYAHLPLAESQALELAKAGKDAPKLWASVLKQSPKLGDGSPCTTAKKIAEIRKAMLSPKPSPPAQPQAPKDEPPRKDKADGSATSEPPPDEPSKPVNGIGKHEDVADLPPGDQNAETCGKLRSLSVRINSKFTEIKALAEELGLLCQKTKYAKLRGSASLTASLDSAARSCKAVAAAVRDSVSAGECSTCKGKGGACRDCNGDGFQSVEERRDAFNRSAAGVSRGALA